MLTYNSEYNTVWNEARIATLDVEEPTADEKEEKKAMDQNQKKCRELIVYEYALVD